MTETFTQKLRRIIAQNDTRVLLHINPILLQMPAPVRAYDDPFLPFGKTIINATRDVVCGYMFNFPAYLAIGAAGIVALERTIAYVGTELITIIDGEFAGAGYAHLLDEGTFNADAVTLANAQHLSAYTVRSDRTAFVVDGDVSAEGVLLRDTQEMMIDNLCLKIIGDEAVYADGTHAFADTLRARLFAYREG